MNFYGLSLDVGLGLDMVFSLRYSYLCCLLRKIVLKDRRFTFVWNECSNLVYLATFLII